MKSTIFAIVPYSSSHSCLISQIGKLRPARLSESCMSSGLLLGRGFPDCSCRSLWEDVAVGGVWGRRGERSSFIWSQTHLSPCLLPEVWAKGRGRVKGLSLHLPPLCPGPPTHPGKAPLPGSFRTLLLVFDRHSSFLQNWHYPAQLSHIMTQFGWFRVTLG